MAWEQSATDTWDMSVDTMVVSDRLSCRVVGDLVFLDCKVCRNGTTVDAQPREHFLRMARDFIRLHSHCVDPETSPPDGQK